MASSTSSSPPPPRRRRPSQVRRHRHRCATAPPPLGARHPQCLGERSSYPIFRTRDTHKPKWGAVSVPSVEGVFCPFKTHFGSGSPNEAMVGDILTNTDWRQQPKSGQATFDQKSKRQKGKSAAPKQESEARQRVARKSGRISNPVPPRSGNRVKPIGPRRTENEEKTQPWSRSRRTEEPGKKEKYSTDRPRRVGSLISTSSKKCTTQPGCQETIFQDAKKRFFY
jgi:hypothetical protein